ncbi:MAG: hypothetical protein HOB01_11655 [Gammaproteobacteria bacterium]|jgi:hypothetical protein|nr:hypothetical protein [Gammaproteobacteria bacterium]
MAIRTKRGDVKQATAKASDMLMGHGPTSAKSKIGFLDEEAERMLQRTRSLPPVSREVAAANLSIYVPVLFQLN